MSDPTQNPRPDENESPPPSSGEEGAAPPPPPPPTSEEEGSYGTQPPPQGGWQQPGPMPPPGGWPQPGAMPPPPAGQTGGIGQPADLMPRFFARLIDLALAWVVILIVDALLVGLFVGVSGGVGNNFLQGGTAYAVGAVVSILGAALLFGYFTLMEAKRGQTVGKMLMRLETRGPDGGRPTMEQAAKRNAFTGVGVLGAVPVLSFLTVPLFLAAVITIAVTISNNKTNRHGWHDDFAGGTTVFRIG